jgi:predicted O-linked N-acetylglucosamine transferase (SPINDLY family)
LSVESIHAFKDARVDNVVLPVLGMQHSGIDLVSELLSRMGAQLEAPSQNSNATYFQLVNSQLLMLIGCDPSGLDAPQKIANAARLSGRISVDEPRKREIFSHLELASCSGPWGWSDPRTVLTLDFWLRLLQEMGFHHVRPVIVVRNPVEVTRWMVADVASSGNLQPPSGRLQHMAYELWLTYHRILWGYCCRHRWTVVTYEALSDSTQLETEAGRLARACGLSLISTSELQDWERSVAHSWLQPGFDSQQVVPAEAAQLYEQFIRLATTTQAHLTESPVDRDEARLVRKAQGLKEAGRIDAAVDLLSKALQIRPQYRAARIFLGYTLMETGHIVKSFQHSDWLIDTDPSDPVGHGLRAFGLTQQARIDEALVEFRECLSGRPENSIAWSNLLFSSLYSDSLAPEEVTALHREASSAITKASQTELPAPWQSRAVVADHRSDRALRIGYLSADLKKHPVGYFLRSLLQHHDTQGFEIFCYHTSPARDELTAALQQKCQHWCQVHSLSDRQLTERIRSDNIDLLIDLSGHSSGNRCGVILQRAAPAQAMYLGYPATSGLAGMDFNIADGHLSPPEYNHLYSERVARLANCFLCFHPHDDSPEVAPAPYESNGYVTFGSFNNLPKISRTTVALWSELLARVPKARLVLKALSLVDEGTREFFHQQFSENGVDRGRVDLLPPTIPLSKFLEEYRRIDIGLDPVPYNGGTTTCEALWMGIPVITLPGTTFCSRMGLSILHTLGREEWIARSKDDYIRIAAELAEQPLRIRQYRKELRGQMLASPLCDGPSFTADFEKCCRWMVVQVEVGSNCQP